MYGLFIGCLVVFTYLYTLVYLDYIKCVQMNEFVDFDVRTITAGDYSVCFDLEVDTYDAFKNKLYDCNNPMSENAQFKLYIKLELENRINDMDDLGFREEEERDKPIEIAQISFAYENGDIIEKLKYRGDYIAKEEYKKVKEINAELHEMVTKNDKFLDKC